jgi:hypothetical protein
LARPFSFLSTLKKSSVLLAFVQTVIEKRAFLYSINFAGSNPDLSEREASDEGQRVRSHAGRKRRRLTTRPPSRATQDEVSEGGAEERASDKDEAVEDADADADADADSDEDLDAELQGSDQVTIRTRAMRTRRGIEQRTKGTGYWRPGPKPRTPRLKLPLHRERERSKQK